MLIRRLFLVVQVWDDKPTYRKSWAGNLLVWSDLTLDPSFKVKGSLLRFAGYIHNHKILPGNIFGLILKNKVAATGIFLSVIKSAYNALIIGRTGLGW